MKIEELLDLPKIMTKMEAAFEDIVYDFVPYDEGNLRDSLEVSRPEPNISRFEWLVHDEETGEEYADIQWGDAYPFKRTPGTVNYWGHEAFHAYKHVLDKVIEDE